jgi:hypothetical protein
MIEVASTASTQGTHSKCYKKSTGPSSVHMWIKFCAKYLNNRNPIIKHVTEKHGKKTKIKKINNSHPPTAQFYLFQSTNNLLANRKVTNKLLCLVQC